jgi:hypothetical protein
MARFRTSEESSNEVWEGKHRAEHWYRDNSVYFITARCRDKFPAFASENAKIIFWERFELAIAQAGFQPWVTSLLDNHYHTIGYLERGDALPGMMKTLHGGTAKLVNDLLYDQFRTGELLHYDCLVEGRLTPFWCDSRKRNYFDGCLRDEKQGRLTHKYVLTQAERHGVAGDHRRYPHTRLVVDVEEAIRFALERDAFMRHVRYKRYEGGVPGAPMYKPPTRSGRRA